MLPMKTRWLVTAMMLTTMMASATADHEGSPAGTRQEDPLVFAVISDLHVGHADGVGCQVKVQQALRHLTGRSKLDALVVVGDLTEDGKASQYKELVQFFGNKRNILHPVDNYLFMMGNHDNYDSNGQANYQNGLKMFNGYKSYPLHQYVLIKGYPFITISDLGTASNDIYNWNNGTTSYPATSVNTLKRYLEQAVHDAPGKPIFVFTHVPPRWTCFSTWVEYENEAWAMEVLNPVLNQYPQAVVFGGHSHYPLGDPRSIHQGVDPNSERNNYYTVINTSTTSYSEIYPGAVDAGIHPENNEYVTEGMIVVEQPNGDIEIRRYDTFRDVEIDPEHRWVLKAPFDGSQFQYADIRDADDNPNMLDLRDGLPAPAFNDGAQLTLFPGAYDVKVTFPQATDNECVFRYNVRILQNGEVAESAFVFSQFYLTTDMPALLSYTISNLRPATPYTIEVVAYDSYDNQSEALTASFITKNALYPVPATVGVTMSDADVYSLNGIRRYTLQRGIHIVERHKVLVK